MATTTEPTTTKQKRTRLVSDFDLLKKLVSTLEKEKFTKEELAEKLSIEPKKLTDSVILAAVKYAGNSGFLGNLEEKSGRGVRRKDPKYIEKTGLLIQPWQFEGRGIQEGQRYSVKFHRKGAITLSPVDSDGDGEE